MSRINQVYSADSSALDFRQVFRAMGRGLRDGRYLAHRLFWRELKGQYSRSVFGVVWDFVEPLVWALVFIVIYNSGVFESGGIDIKKPVFIVFGILLWQTFVDSLTGPLGLIQKSQKLISHQRVPPEALLLSVLYRILFFYSFRLSIMAGVAVALDEWSFIGFLKFLLLSPSIVLAGYGLGVLLEPFNVIYADIGRFVKIVVRPLMFISPVVFNRGRIPIFEPVAFLNPATVTLDTLRQLATRNVLAAPGEFWGTCLVASCLLLLGWYIFHVSIPILVDRT